MNEDKYCPIGEVELVDDLGNVLFSKHNMIVKSGRQLIFNKFLNNADYSDIDIKAVILQTTDDNVVSEDDRFVSTEHDIFIKNIKDVPEVQENKISYDAEKKYFIDDNKKRYITTVTTEDQQFFEKIQNEEDLQIGYISYIHSIDIKSFNQVMLMYSKPGVTLFSRLITEKLTLDSKRHYTLRYFIYF